MQQLRDLNAEILKAMGIRVGHAMKILKFRDELLRSRSKTTEKSTKKKKARVRAKREARTERAVFREWEKAFRFSPGEYIIIEDGNGADLFEEIFNGQYHNLGDEDEDDSFEEFFESGDTSGQEMLSARELRRHRQTLGIKSDRPSPEEVKKAYHVMAMKWHPDRHQGDDKKEAEARFKTISEAYTALCAHC